MFSKLLTSNRRTNLLRKNIFFSFLFKGWTGLVYLLLVPITLKCLGVYENGVWMTLSAMLIWLDNMDVGLGNGLRNQLAESLAINNYERARQLVSNTIWMLLIIVIPAFFLLSVLVFSVDIYKMLNISPEIINNIKQIILISLLFVCITFIFKFVGNIYLALQLPAVNTFLVGSSYTVALIGTYMLYYINRGSLLNVAIVNTASPLLVYLISIPITLRRYPYLTPRIADFNLDISKGLFTLGIKFFLLQVTSSLVFISSSIIMSKRFGPAMVTPFQITYRYFSIILHLFAVVCSPYWSATTDAYKSNDMQWVVTAGYRLRKVIVLSWGTIVMLILASPVIYPLWLGSAVKISWTSTIGMALYIGMTIYSLGYCYFLNGFGTLKIQLYCTVLSSVAFFPITFLLSDMLNHEQAILWSLCIFLLPNMIFNRIQFYKITHYTAKGIWLQ